MPPSDELRPDDPQPGATPAVTPKARPSGRSMVPAEPATQQRAVAALFVALLSLVGWFGLNDLGRGLVVVLFALLSGLVALWLGLTAIRGARRTRTALPRGCVTASVIASLGILMSGVMLLGFAVFGQQLTRYGNCLSGANTIAAQQSCQNQFTRSLSRTIPGISIGTRP